MELQPHPQNPITYIAGLCPANPVDVGEVLDSANNFFGLEIINQIDKRAAEYAASHFSGC